MVVGIFLALMVWGKMMAWEKRLRIYGAIPRSTSGNRRLSSFQRLGVVQVGFLTQPSASRLMPATPTPWVVSQPPGD